MPLLGLSNELLLIVFANLDSLYDHASLVQTCKTLCNIGMAATIDPAAIHHQESSTPSAVYNHMLTAVKARSIADWAVQMPANRLVLEQTLRDGSESLLELSYSLFPLKLADIQLIHSKKKTIIKPLVAKIVASKSGHIFTARPWMKVDVEIMIISYWAYCDMFHHSFDFVLNGSGIEPLNLATRDAFQAAIQPKTTIYLRFWDVHAFWFLGQTLGHFRAALFNHSERAGRRAGLLLPVVECLGEKWLKLCLDCDQDLVEEMYREFRKTFPWKGSAALEAVKRDWCLRAIGSFEYREGI
ncbi:MAG: hypothetical protein MMC33_010552 [Icmadophila ericetorum]|nr:hypothetical protein [Icmadophila ericetorum]